MALDGIVLQSIVYDLHTALVGGRIDRVFQPDRHTVVLLVRQPGKNLRVLISSDPQQARIQLTDIQTENPDTPPAFCMLLRKHLEGGRLVAIQQQQLDRIIHLVVETWDEPGGITTRTLIIEIMGKHSNVILLNHQKYILDALHRISGAFNRHREILPGRLYVGPPGQVKQDPFTTDLPAVCSLLAAASPQQKLANVLVQGFVGFGPGTAREILVRAGLTPEATASILTAEHQTRLAGIFIEFVSALKQHCYNPTVVISPDGSGVVDFACYDLLQYPATDRRYYSAMDQAMDFFFRSERIKSTPGKDGLLKLIRNEKNRAERKLQLQQTEVQEGKQAEQYKIIGDLLTANLSRMHKGQSEITVLDYYDPAQPEIIVNIEPKLTPVENTQHYYNRYAKAKRSVDILTQQIAETHMEINYLDALLVQLSDASSKAELQEIRLELSEQGYLAPITYPGKKNKRPTAAPSVPLRFLSPDGWEIFVGKNNKQNDFVTFKLGRAHDVWLHTKDIPGSHVIVRTPNPEIPPRTLEMAAKLAAYFSKSRTSSQVPVDYTLRKHVHKPSGAKPGFVIYEQQHTIYVTPDETIVQIANQPVKKPLNRRDAESAEGKN